MNGEAEKAPHHGSGAHLAFLRIVCVHKLFVFLAGLRTGAPIWRLVIHDWTKFTPAEWGPYMRRYGRLREKPVRSPLEKAAEPLEFHMAWTRHWQRHQHHWEHWLRLDDAGGLVAMPMSEPAVREMVADWMGASRAYTGSIENTRGWYEANGHSFNLHPETRTLVEKILFALLPSSTKEEAP